MTGGMYKRFGVTLIEAPIDVVSYALSNYFRAECCMDIFPADLQEKEKHFLWQYGGHSWTIWWAFAREKIAFALALFLGTKAIVLTHQGTSGWSEFKMFYQDKFVEHYHFGFDDREPNEKIGDRFWSAGYWDIEIVQKCVYPSSPMPSWYRHLFCSTLRQVTEEEMRMSLATMPDEFGFLDATFRYYRAYLPDYEETPLAYDRADSDFQSNRADFERIDAVSLPKEAFYWQNVLPVPSRVS